MIGTCGDPGVELNKEGNRFESFRPGSCPAEPKVLFNGASDATFANSCSPKSIEGGDGVNIGWYGSCENESMIYQQVIFKNLKIRWMYLTQFFFENNVCMQIPLNQ